MEIKDLELQGIISFNGTTNNTLKLHPDRKHILYPMGNKVSIKNLETSNQNFLTGHTNLISALSVSPCGKFVASGQVNHPGFKAPVIIWSFKSREIMDKHDFHKVRIEDICFSCSSSYVISLGGKDDGNILVWDIQKKRPVCGTIASTDISGNTFKIMNTNLREACFVSGGENILKLWQIDPVSRKLNGYEIKVGKLKRTFNSIAIDGKDEFAYCGTTTGDIIKVRLNFGEDLKNTEPVYLPVMIDCYCKISKDAKKRKNNIGDLYEGGINTILLLNGALIVGAGDGTVELIEILEEEKTSVSNKNQVAVKSSNVPRNKLCCEGTLNEEEKKSVSSKKQVVVKSCEMKCGEGTLFDEKKKGANKKQVKSPNVPRIKSLARQNVFSSVTSMIRIGDHILVGTAMCEIYKIELMNFAVTLTITCHTHAIYDVAFPHNYSEVFATASNNDIRLWQLETQKELLRITIPNFICYSLCFSYDGTMIISAWNDGSIKAFTPQTGRLIFSIHKAHLKAVTAVVVVKKGDRIISAGCDAQVRIWSIKPDVQRLVAVLIEHAGPITHLDISKDDLFVVSSSTDGTCIIWDIEKQARKHVIMAKTMFTSAIFALHDAQILTCGSDRKVAYWETLDSSLVRELEGSSSASLNCIDISEDSRSFVTGSADFMVKFWDYQLGEVSHIGLGHAAMITACKISPDGKSIVTVSVDGTIMIWQCPPSLNNFDLDDTASVKSSTSAKTNGSVKSNAIKSEKGTVRTDRSGKKIENVDLSSRSHETVKSVHKGDPTSTPCSHDPSEPNQSVCTPKEEEKKCFSSKFKESFASNWSTPREEKNNEET